MHGGYPGVHTGMLHGRYPGVHTGMLHGGAPLRRSDAGYAQTGTPLRRGGAGYAQGDAPLRRGGAGYAQRDTLRREGAGYAQRDTLRREVSMSGTTVRREVSMSGTTVRKEGVHQRHDEAQRGVPSAARRGAERCPKSGTTMRRGVSGMLSCCAYPSLYPALLHVPAVHTDPGLHIDARLSVMSDTGYAGPAVVCCDAPWGSSLLPAVGGRRRGNCSARSGPASSERRREVAQH